MPLDALQTIISDPQYASVDAPTRHKIAQKALADPDVKALSQEDQFALTKSILFPTEEKAPELAGNLSLSEIPGAMGEQIGSGIQNLKQAITGEGAILPNMVKGAAKIIGGIGLLKGREWGRILILVVSFLSLISIPFGTALGIYSMIILFNPQTIKLFNPNAPGK